MMPKVTRIIKKADIVKPPFNKDLCLTEAANYERVMMFHLSRCDDKETARILSEKFSGLSEAFDKKRVDLEREVR